MKPLPGTQSSLVLRTDFSDDAAWAEVCAAIQQPNADGFRAHVTCMSDTDYEGLTVEQLVALAPKGGNRTFVLLVDSVTLTHPERPVLVVDLYGAPSRSFRAIPCAMWAVENNLRIANMDFDEFADNVNPDGVFRGFPRT